MNRLILVSYSTNNGQIVKELLDNDYQLNVLKHTNNYSEIDIIYLSVSGSSYQEKQQNASDLAKRFQDFMFTTCNIDLSILEVSRVCEFFEKIGFRYGLTKEFQEEGII